MKKYEDFALVYDELMDNVPYEKWWERLEELLRDHGICGGLALDLCCGTGKMTRLMQKAGFDMIGIDASEQMLSVARDSSDDHCLYLQQDIRDFELYGTVGAVVSVCDSLNYITDPGDLARVFSLVSNYLDPGGIFLFDMNTEHMYRDEIGDTVIAEDREDVSFIWCNEYDEDSHLNEILLSVFVREEGDLYRRYEEEHIQRGYRKEEVIHLLEESGLAFLAAFDGYSDREAGEDAGRILFAAQECRKDRKGY